MMHFEVELLKILQYNWIIIRAENKNKPMSLPFQKSQIWLNE